MAAMRGNQVPKDQRCVRSLACGLRPSDLLEVIVRHHVVAHGPGHSLRASVKDTITVAKIMAAVFII